MSQVPANPSERDGSEDRYYEYTEKLTEHLLQEMDERRLSKSRLADYAELLMDNSTVRIPMIEYKNFDSMDNFFAVHLILLESERSLYPDTYEDTNKRAFDEASILFESTSDEVLAYSETHWTEKGDNVKESYRILSARKKLRDAQRVARQILTGEPASKEDAEWEIVLYETVLPNFVQALRILNVIVN